MGLDIVKAIPALRWDSTLDIGSIPNVCSVLCLYDIMIGRITAFLSIEGGELIYRTHKLYFYSRKESIKHAGDVFDRPFGQR
ncbi:hypothetical protein SAMN04487895_109200 [Paenibacillus sophorae]|uniref:Uncharacterized protein n=1 Tax=Paenibacillus sophorae TaxID=1333845 RepID=A0A1H8RA53_9BACL|nr:hypothetical protein SAMN04487895_109200 [Paenibacillus sophorae]